MRSNRIATLLTRVVRLVLVLGELVRAVEEHRGEDEQHGGELADDRDAGGEEDATEHQRADHAEEQHPVLILARHLEVAEDQREDEQVVDRQALLEQPRGRELDTGGSAERQGDDAREGKRDADPHRAPPCSFPETNDVCAAVGEQIDREHDDNDSGEGDPRPERNIHSSSFAACACADEGSGGWFGHR